jgi:hypothetical protein
LKQIKNVQERKRKEKQKNEFSISNKSKSNNSVLPDEVEVKITEHFCDPVPPHDVPFKTLSIPQQKKKVTT